jgi:phytoene dehydrogenase-like protein
VGGKLLAGRRLIRRKAARVHRVQAAEGALREDDTMSGKSILIVGAGIGGLAAGCYARMNGYPTTILEMHTTPGGVCTSWHRDGYTFDGSIHNLGGTSPDSALHGMWRELGVVPALAMHAFEELVRVDRPQDLPDGPPLIVYTDLDRLGRHLKDWRRRMPRSSTS